MSLQGATLLVNAVYVYLLLGVLLLPWWLLRGLRALDHQAALGGIGFRLLIVPGLVALWPVLLPRALVGKGHPPEEDNAHRRAARNRTALP